MRGAQTFVVVGALRRGIVLVPEVRGGLGRGVCEDMSMGSLKDGAEREGRLEARGVGVQEMVGVFADVDESSSSDSSALMTIERRVLPRRGVGVSMRPAAMAAFALDMGESFLKGDSEAIVGVSGADSSSSSSSRMARGAGFFLLSPSFGGAVFEAVTRMAFGARFGVVSALYTVAGASFRAWRGLETGWGAGEVESKRSGLGDGARRDDDIGSEVGGEGCILVFAVEFCKALRTAGP